MAALTFANLQTEVYDHSGLDSTDANNQTRVQRWINYVQQDICARWPWNFLRSRESIVTVIDVTGTAGVTNTAIPRSRITASKQAPAPSGLYLQFAGANDWYKISSFWRAKFSDARPALPRAFW